MVVYTCMLLRRNNQMRGSVSGSTLPFFSLAHVCVGCNFSVVVVRARCIGCCVLLCRWLALLHIPTFFAMRSPSCVVKEPVCQFKRSSGSFCLSLVMRAELPVARQAFDLQSTFHWCASHSPHRTPGYGNDQAFSSVDPTAVPPSLQTSYTKFDV